MHALFSQLQAQHPLANPTCMQCRICSQRGLRKAPHAAYLAFQHLKPAPGGDEEGLQAATAESHLATDRATAPSGPALSAVRDCYPQKQAHNSFLGRSVRYSWSNTTARWPCKWRCRSPAPCFKAPSLALAPAPTSQYNKLLHHACPVIQLINRAGSPRSRTSAKVGA